MLIRIYETLLKAYGPQNWWPVTSQGNVPQYSGGPKTGKQRFEVIVGAVLTQNTSWKNVEKAIININDADLMEIEKLSRVTKKRLASIIKPAGYFNQKAEKLIAMAKFLRNTRVKYDKWELREQLLSIKGIGPETADSIVLYAFNQSIFVIDNYTKRIFSRIGLIPEKSTYEECQEFFHNKLKHYNGKIKLFNEYHALIVEHAKRYCKKKPLCKNCIIRRYCRNKDNF